MGPAHKLINSKTRNEDWNPHLAGAPKSVLASRQHTQHRAHRNQWVDHPKCTFCLHAAVTGTKHVASMPNLTKPLTMKAETGNESNGTNNQQRTEQGGPPPRPPEPRDLHQPS